jgi:hypothetical protein
LRLIDGGDHVGLRADSNLQALNAGKPCGYQARGAVGVGFSQERWKVVADKRFDWAFAAAALWTAAMIAVLVYVVVSLPYPQ